MYSVWKLFLLMITMKLSTEQLLVNDKTILRNYVEDLIRLKENNPSRPYQKFIATFARLNLCTLHRVQRLELCDQFLGNRPFEFVFQFDNKFSADLSCKKIQVHLEGAAAVDSFVETQFITAFKCPDAFKIELLTFLSIEKVIRPVSVRYFLSSGLVGQSAILYYRHIGWNCPVMKVDRAVIDLSTIPLDHAINNYKRLDYKILKKFVPSEMPVGSTTAWPIKFQSGMSEIQSPQIAECALERFLKDVKENGEPYQKFINTYKRINVCGIETEKLISLCKHAYENSEFKYRIRPSYDISAACRRQNTYFTHQITNPVLMSLVQCIMQGPAPKDSYFISTSSYENTLIGYVRLHPHEEIFPNLYIKNVIMETETPVH